jgi:rhamnosyltransferase
MNVNGQSKTAAVIVGYNPEYAVMYQLLDLVSTQVDTLILVDNGGAEAFSEFKGNGTVNYIYIDAGKNAGLGCGLNIGCRIAVEQGADYIALFDQDSAPPRDLIANLLSSHRKLVEKQINCAAIGPVYYDRRESEIKYFNFYREIGNKIITISPSSSDEQMIQVDALITSGMLIRSSVLLNGFYFDESLFVEYTDSEWCFRVRHAGYQLFADMHVVMPHTPAESPAVRLFGLSFYRYSPVRRYYWYRNTMVLLQSKTFGSRWKRRLFIGLCLRFAINIIIDSNKISSLRMMIKGMWDGLLNRSGPYV